VTPGYYYFLGTVYSETPKPGKLSTDLTAHPNILPSADVEAGENSGRRYAYGWVRGLVRISSDGQTLDV
jgi:hypothetical protein